MKYLEEMNELINKYMHVNIMEEAIAERLNKSLDLYIYEIQEEFEDASSTNRLRVLKALKGGINVKS